MPKSAKIKIGLVCAFALLLVITAPRAMAADAAVLRNGFSIRHERREIIGEVTRLFVGGDEFSFVDVPTAEIDHFEAVPVDPSPQLVPSPKFVKSRITAPVKQSVDLNQVVAQASGTYRLDPDLVNSVIRAESGFNVHAVSPKGARGLMQLMPQTASQLGVQNTFDAEANVEGGTKYLRELLERYDFDLIKALAAYNAGPQRVEQYGGVPPYSETKAYVARIVRDFNKKKLAEKAAAKPATPKSAGSKPAKTPAQNPTAHGTKAQTQTNISKNQVSE